MRKIGSLLATSVTLGVLSVTTGSAAAAAPGAPVHYFTFTRAHQSFSHDDSVGEFHAQVAVVRPFPGYPMPWAFTIGPKLRAIATTRASCVAGGLNGRYHDTHTVPVGYVWHSTVRPHRTKKVYQLWGHCTFGVQVGGRPGTAHVGFTFNYAIDPSSGFRAEPQADAESLQTTLRIDRPA